MLNCARKRNYEILILIENNNRVGFEIFINDNYSIYFSDIDFLPSRALVFLHELHN